MLLPSDRIRPVIVSLLIALVACIGAEPVRAQVEFGKVSVAGGATLERVNDLQSTDVTASFERPIGYHFGVTYDQSIGPVYVRPGFVVRRAGTFQFPSSLEGPGHTLLEGRSFDVWTFEFPIDVRYPYEVRGNDVYAFAGPMLSIPRAEEDFDRSFPNATLAIGGGVGGEFDLPDLPLVLAPELRYSYDLTNTVKKEFQLRGRSFETEGLNLNGLSFRLHVYYPLPF